MAKARPRPWEAPKQSGKAKRKHKAGDVVRDAEGRQYVKVTP